MSTSPKSHKEFMEAWACSQHADTGGVNFGYKHLHLPGLAGLSRLNVPVGSGVRAAPAAAALPFSGVWETIELGFANNSSDE